MTIATELTGTRPAAAAGTFYPGDPERLRADVGGLLAAAPGSDAAAKALIAPHAGYGYSGTVAATAFAPLKRAGKAVRRVIVIGPAHYVRFLGIAAPTAESFATPLGRVPVDHEAIDVLQKLSFVTQNDAAHAPEHCIEVELPFLQTLLPAFSLVPLVVGDATPQQVAATLRHIWGGPETLIVVSSDLSHYHLYDIALRLDLVTAEAIERGDWAAIDATKACGFLAIAGLLIEAQHHGLRARRLALCNSGDTAGDRRSVVGYGAWAFAG